MPINPFDYTYTETGEEIFDLPGSLFEEGGALSWESDPAAFMSYLEDFSPEDVNLEDMFYGLFDMTGGEDLDEQFEWGENLYDVESQFNFETYGDTDAFIEQIARAGFGIDVPQDIINQFIEGYGPGLEGFAPSTETGLYEDLSTIYDQYELQEESMFSSYSDWEQAQQNILETQAEYAGNEYQRGVEEININQKIQEQALRAQKMDYLKGATSGIKQATGQAGRTGLAGGTAYKGPGRGITGIEQSLKGLSNKERKLAKDVDAQLSGIEQGYGTALYQMQQSFGQAQEERLGSIWSELDVMRTNFAQDVTGVYDRWYTDLAEQFTAFQGVTIDDWTFNMAGIPGGDPEDYTGGG